MTRDDILRDERLKRYSAGKATPAELAELQSLAETEPLYREALETFAPWTEAETKRFLENIASRGKLMDLRSAVRALLRDAGPLLGVEHSASLRRVLALLEDDE